MTLKGRVALVTGGSRGIGRAIALTLARDGADVAISYARDEDAAGTCVDAIHAEGRRGHATRAAAEDPDAQHRLVEIVGNELGPIDVLVNNVGYDWDGTAVADTDPEDLLRVMRVNLHPTSAVWPRVARDAPMPARRHRDDLQHGHRDSGRWIRTLRNE